MYIKLMKSLFVVMFLLVLGGCGEITTTAITTAATTIQTTEMTTTATTATTATTTSATTAVTTATTAATTAITTAPTTTTTTDIITITTIELVQLPDLTGENRENITSILTDLGLEISFYFDVSIIYEEDGDYDKFIQYGSGKVVGDFVEIGSTVKVYTSPLTLTVKYLYQLDEYTDSLGQPLLIDDSDYLGKEFIADGIGVATVYRYIDGDTTWFSTGSNSFSVRYLGIDTPESTALYEPWGKAAAQYTREKLENAETIVLQAEGVRLDGNGRYLAWVWYRDTAESDFVLLNLELVELAYSKNKVSSGSKFTTILTLADWDASDTKRRVWGETDPAYDYSKEGAQMSIEYLMNNFSDYVGLKVVITGTITKKIGANVFFQDETGYGVYMYAGYTISAQLQIGANLTIGGLVPAYFSGSPQLSNFKTYNLTVNASGEDILPITITYNDFVFEKIGTLVKMDNLTITSINAAKTSVYVQDTLLNSFVIKIDDLTGFDADEIGLSVGNVINVVGPLGYYDYYFDSATLNYVYLKTNFQLMLTDASDILVQ